MATGRNKRSVLPTRGRASGSPDRVMRTPEGAFAVSFSGEDGRSRSFTTASRPLPGLHEGFARAFETVTGFDGRRRTLMSAEGSWDAGLRFLSFLADPAPPEEVDSQSEVSEIVEL